LEQSTDQLDIALTELEDKAYAYRELIAQVKRLVENTHFRYISKQRRNELLRSILDHAADLDDTSRAVFRMLKKVKRTKAPETLIDALVGAGDRAGRTSNHVTEVPEDLGQ